MWNAFVRRRRRLLKSDLTSSCFESTNAVVTFQHYGISSVILDLYRGSIIMSPMMQMSHAAQSRGVLYAASDLATTLAEFFQHRRRRINRSDQQPWLAAFRLPGTIPLLDLTDTFSVIVGASSNLFTGSFRHTQAWSRGFYEAYPDIQGLYYRSSLTNRITVMFYERTSTQQLFPANPGMHRPLDSPLMLRSLTIAAQEIGYRLT